MKSNRMIRNVSHRSRRGQLFASAVFGGLLLAGTVPMASAIQPQRWVHTTEADFEPGDPDGTVITNLGDIKLAAETQSLEGLPEGVGMVYDIQRVGGFNAFGSEPDSAFFKELDGLFRPVHCGFCVGFTDNQTVVLDDDDLRCPVMFFLIPVDMVLDFFGGRKSKPDIRNPQGFVPFVGKELFQAFLAVFGTGQSQH